MCDFISTDMMSPFERSLHAKPPFKTGMHTLPFKHDTSKVKILAIM